MPWKFYDKYPAGDARLQTIATEYITNTGTTVNRSNGLPAAIPLKYTRYVPNLLVFDYVIYGYVDVLFAIAEITNEISEATAEAIEYLKLVLTEEEQLHLFRQAHLPIKRHLEVLYLRNEVGNYTLNSVFVGGI